MRVGVTVDKVSSPELLFISVVISEKVVHSQLADYSLIVSPRLYVYVISNVSVRVLRNSLM